MKVIEIKSIENSQIFFDLEKTMLRKEFYVENKDNKLITAPVIFTFNNWSLSNDFMIFQINFEEIRNFISDNNKLEFKILLVDGIFDILVKKENETSELITIEIFYTLNQEINWVKDEYKFIIEFEKVKFLDFINLWEKRTDQFQNLLKELGIQ